MSPPAIEDPAEIQVSTESDGNGTPAVCEELGLPVISDHHELRARGICKVRIPGELDIDHWAKELSRITPMIMGFEGDGEYAFYRNIMEEPEFPFDSILLGDNRGSGDDYDNDNEDASLEACNSSIQENLARRGLSEIGRAALRHFPIVPTKEKLSDEDDGHKILSEELQLDDAFCVHYNMDQDDTTGKKHTDPSDITINLCLQKSKDAEGSYVLFYGTKRLENLAAANDNSADAAGVEDFGSKSAKTPLHHPNLVANEDTAVGDDRFLVVQEPGYATIHFGDHPHETTALRQGSRTNVVLTYVYTDPSRSDVATRTCYG